MNKLINAINYATIAHNKQRRKNATKDPYINHPIEVMKILSDAGVDDVDILAAAVLHDTIEDTNVTAEGISQIFGENVAALVSDCSDDRTLSKIERKKYQIVHGYTISDGAKMIKLADKCSNVGGLFYDPPSSWTSEEIDGYIYWSISVFNSIRGVNPVLDNQFISLMNENNFDVDMDKEDLNNKLANYYKNFC